MTDHRTAFRDFQQALDRLLEAHGERFTDRSRIQMAGRPGMFLLSEVDGAEGERPRLLIACDDRDPATFGERVKLKP